MALRATGQAVKSAGIGLSKVFLPPVHSFSAATAGAEAELAEIQVDTEAA